MPTDSPASKQPELESSLEPLPFEADAELEALVSQLPPEVLKELGGLLLGLLCSMASSVAQAAKDEGFLAVDAAAKAGHRALLTGPVAGFESRVANALCYRLHPDLRVAPLLRRLRSFLDDPSFDARLLVASVALHREDDEVWVLPRLNGFEPAPARDPNWVRATVARFGASVAEVLPSSDIHDNGSLPAQGLAN